MYIFAGLNIQSMLSVEPMTDILEVAPATEKLQRNLPENCVTFEQFKNDYFRLLKQRYETV